MTRQSVLAPRASDAMRVRGRTLSRFKRVGGQLLDPIRPASSLAVHAFAALSPLERRRRLCRALGRKRPNDDYFRAVRDPVLRALAIDGALRALKRGHVGWAFVARWVTPKRARAAVLLAAKRCKAAGLDTLSSALGYVGGPEARRHVEGLFERVVVRQRPSGNTSEPLYDAAAALVRLSPRRVDAARVLVEGLKHDDLLARSAAARAVSSIDVRARGAGADLLRAELRAHLRAPDSETFFTLEGLMRELSPRAFLRACRLLLESDMGEVAAERLVRFGGRRGRTTALAWLGTHLDFDAHITVVSALSHQAPSALLLRTIRRGMRRRSPFDRKRTISLLGRSRLPQTAPIAREALLREPDAALRSELEAVLREI